MKLEVEALEIELMPVRAPVVSGISFAVEPGETLALVGESGCGKTVTALSLLSLLEDPLRVAGGRALWGGRDLLALPDRELRRVRGREIAMIFQEPMTALNPVLTVGDQIAEGMRLHLGLSASAARARTLERMREVGIADVERRIDQYPHEMSGGMRQRAMIAMALACDPALLIADEPTTALDVTVQAQILELLRELQRTRGMSILLITHDLGVVAETAARVAVMYAGRIVEQAEVGALFDRPQHPYTRGLFRARPASGPPVAIEGQVPPPGAHARGCRFHPRCGERLARCEVEVPAVTEFPGGTVACHARALEQDA